MMAVMRNANLYQNVFGRLGVAIGLACMTGVTAVSAMEIGPAIDQDEAMLDVPTRYDIPRGFVMAKTPPRITFYPVEGLESVRDIDGAVWTNFSEGICAPDGWFYVAFNNNAAIDGNCVLYSYDPATRQQNRVLDVGAFLGTKPGQFGHGKIHGRLDLMPNGQVPMITYCSLESDKLSALERAQHGGALLVYNVFTGDATHVDTPVLGEAYPMHATDIARGVFHGIGLLGGYLAYDLKTSQLIYGGPLPGDVRWGPRATLVDPKTGCCYGSDPATRRIVKFDPAEARFAATDAYVPTYPAIGKHDEPVIRSYTRRRLPDGSFVAHTTTGMMFKFYPDEQRTAVIGPNWAEGGYCTAMAMSRDGRYIYYTVGLHTEVFDSGTPIIQFDTQTYTRKVLAFVQPFYRAKCNYTFGTSYSITLDADDANLLIVWNGAFTKRGREAEAAMGEPVLMYVEIPPSERSGNE